MKQFACGAVVSGCTDVFEAENTEQLLREVEVHAREEHGMQELTPALVEQVKTQIRDA